MISKKASDLIAANSFAGQAGYDLVTRRVAEDIVRIVERDARERAISAYQYACLDFWIHRVCLESNTPCNMQCKAAIHFLKSYDDVH